MPYEYVRDSRQGRSWTPLMYNAMAMCYKIPGWPARLTKLPGASRSASK
jgi:hypothetical protein